MSQPVLIALDWGTSNLRACLLDADGQAIEHRSTPGGVMAELPLLGQWAQVQALEESGVERFDIPAFLRKQAD